MLKTGRKPASSASCWVFCFVSEHFYILLADGEVSKADQPAAEAQRSNAKGNSWNTTGAADVVLLQLGPSKVVHILTYLFT